MLIISENRSSAFTLVELLIVIIIIGALAGGMMFAFGGSDEKAKETACLGNREAIKTAWSMYKFAHSSNEDLQTFIDAHYHDQIENNHAECPSNGKYSVDSNNNQLVACSVHNIVSAPIKYVYSAASWADLYNDPPKFLSQLYSVLQDAYIKSGLKDVNFLGENQLKIIANSVPDTGLNEFLTKNNNVLSDFKIYANKNGEITGIALKAGAYSKETAGKNVDTNDVYIVYPNGHVYYCFNDLGAGEKSYLKEGGEAIAKSYVASPPNISSDSRKIWKCIYDGS